MSDGDRNDLREWAEDFAAVGHVQAKQVLALLAENDDLAAFARSLAARVAAQSDLLSAAAERVKAACVCQGHKVAREAFDAIP